VDDANSVRLAALGWAFAAVSLVWALVERGGRKRAERARRERERESDAERVTRIERHREAVIALRKAVDSLEEISGEQSGEEL
jgi:hypothetical protein